MQGAELVERYRCYAAKCLKMSRTIRDPAAKLMILEMAQSWLKLAEQVAEGTETFVPHDIAAPTVPQRD